MNYIVPVGVLIDMCACICIFVALYRAGRSHWRQELIERPVWAWQQLAKNQLFFMAGHGLVVLGSLTLLASTEPVAAKVADGVVAAGMVGAFTFAGQVRISYRQKAELAADALVHTANLAPRIEHWLRHST